MSNQSVSTEQATIDALQRVILGVLEAVREGDELGAPGGLLYAAMQGHGATLSQFQNIMDILVRKGYLTQEGDCYHLTDPGNRYMVRLQGKFGTPAAPR